MAAARGLDGAGAAQHFQRELGEVALAPATGGVFTIKVDDDPVWDRAVDGGFPDIAELKRRVRDRVAPDRRLGHIDAGDAPPESQDR